MANLRLIYDNAADRATLTASSTSGSLAASNLKINEKAAIWRSTSTTATITATWTTAEAVDSVALGWTNLTALATVTVGLYTNVADSVPVSSVTVMPDTALPLGEFVWGVDPLVMGGAQAARVASQAQVWIPTGVSCKKVEIVITDPTNTLGYVEASRLSIGMRYEMAVNPGYGCNLTFVDRSITSRAESADIRTEIRGIYRTLDLDFSMLETADATLQMRLASFGKANALFISLFPDTADVKQQAYAFFAVRSGNHSTAYAFMGRWNNSITFEEIA